MDFPNDAATDYLLLNKDEDFKYSMLFEGTLKNEHDVSVTVTLPDKEEDPPETYTTVYSSK